MTTAVDLTEAELQEQVIELARMLRWRVAHFRPAMTKHGWRTPVAADGKGFPDLLMLRKGRVIFAELKRGPRVNHRGPVASCDCCPTPDQQAWLDAAAAAGAETYVWLPDDLQTIAEALR